MPQTFPWSATLRTAGAIIGPFIITILECYFRSCNKFLLIRYGSIFPTAFILLSVNMFINTKVQYEACFVSKRDLATLTTARGKEMHPSI